MDRYASVLTYLQKKILNFLLYKYKLEIDFLGGFAGEDSKG